MTHHEDIPRPEHPRPQFVRAEERWLNLNGSWQFERDPSDSGLERGLVGRELEGSILVPFCPESELSGIGDPDWHEAVWYRRTVELPDAFPEGDRVLLHCQAVDHDATVWLDGVEVGRHRGGHTSFTLDLTDALAGRRSATLVVRARDPRHEPLPRGKQATWFANTHCQYTRTTGIWQTVWLESVPTAYLERPRITPDANVALDLDATVRHGRVGQRVRAVLSDDAGQVAVAETPVGLQMVPRLRLEVPEDRRRVWQPEDPHLYGLTFELLDAGGEVVDRLDSYAGLRTIAVEGHKVLLNGRPVFQRLVLDQGYWPESLMTAPSEEALVRDVELGLEAGFNGARIHQKIAEERFLHHCDRMGYLVWGEFPDWGVSGQGPAGHNQKPGATFVAQWVEAVERDYSHPSIVGWCPLNETHQYLHDRFTVLDDVTQAMYWATKGMDRTRPVIDASGYSHRVPTTDVWDSHDYTQDPREFAQVMGGLAQGRPHTNTGENTGSAVPGAPDYSTPYAGQPYFCSEYGGIWWVPPQERTEEDATNDEGESWGYGNRPADEEEFYSRAEGLTRVLDQDPRMFGYCYTQLTDVFQEKNGIYAFDRSAKLDMERVRAIFDHPSAYEAAG
ncbi:glycoside hydrolase family 2 protein [Ornithinimicrobium cerasi]|uniref:Glycosyl hydrolases family 2 n=1 Tax=Ornithinimicrobium cerasi TaxID=2248773 RepID=A0A285VID2_9MICO|nr:sugar-binding domain-containing protein [Ornithinimicrobium cerasi]SOC53835.1 Glycosyl hydrolases family 2 [Ornithinimicrobium cerasi]